MILLYLINEAGPSRQGLGERLLPYGIGSRRLPPRCFPRLQFVQENINAFEMSTSSAAWCGAVVSAENGGEGDVSGQKLERDNHPRRMRVFG